MANSYINTDHSTQLLDLDFTNTTQGKGIFRCPPNAHKNPIYSRLIKNTIKKTIYECITPNQKTNLEIALLDTRIKLEEELYSLETKVPSWNTQTRQNTLNFSIAQLLSLEPTNASLLERDLTITKPNLLEYVLQKMKEETIIFSKNDKIDTIQQTTELKARLQDLLSDPE